jgi:hypothetical protein
LNFEDRVLLFAVDVDDERGYERRETKEFTETKSIKLIK